MAGFGVRRTKHMTVKKITGPKEVAVGFPKGKSDSDIVQRAIWNHYGTRGGASGGGWGGPVPARPFLLNAIRNNKKAYIAAMKKSAPKLIRGETTLKIVMSKLGALAQGHVQQSITKLRSPANSETTIALKGSSNPLIDTGEMRSAVTYKVGDK